MLLFFDRLFDRLFNRLFGITKEEEEYRSKYFETINLFDTLCNEYQRMKPEEIIRELYRIHDFHHIPGHSWGSDVSKTLYGILSFILEQDLTEKNVRDLHNMLFWDELKKNTKDRSASLVIIGLMERFPNPILFPLLKEYVLFINNLKVSKQLTGSDCGAGIYEEVTRINSLVDSWKKNDV